MTKPDEIRSADIKRLKPAPDFELLLRCFPVSQLACSDIVPFVNAAAFASLTQYRQRCLSICRA